MIMEIDFLRHCCEKSAHGIPSPKKASVEVDNHEGPRRGKHLQRGARPNASPWVGHRYNMQRYSDIKGGATMRRFAGIVSCLVAALLLAPQVGAQTLPESFVV